MRFALLFIFVLLFSACSSTPKQSHSSSSKVIAAPYAIDLNNQQLVKEKLMAQYVHWERVPYKYGGTTKKGVDCSAFVQNTYQFHFGYQLPRTTRTQMKVGYKVSKSSLKPGDIVFFKVGWSTYHNGLYIGKGKFMHASTSNGVTLSKLSNPYWLDHYLTARRIR